MSDYRQTLVTSIERSLITITDPDTTETIMQKIVCIINTTMRYVSMDDRQVRASYQKHIA